MKKNLKYSKVNLKLVFFDDRAEFRIRREEIRLVKKIVRQFKDKYMNESHFYRVAVLKLIRDERVHLSIKKKWKTKHLNTT